uniref:AAA+ ATPase domain-containing protein n=1 Tax=Leersia perrieri TaxID=77586 RepID=A0A0D9WY83_9ORYZ
MSKKQSMATEQHKKMEGIMVSAATGVMNSVISKLTELLGEEYNLQKGVKQDIAFLKDELSSMNALLEKLADMDVLDPLTNDWRNQVRDMAYDIEDCIDRCMLQLHCESDKPAGIMGFFSDMIKKVEMLGTHHRMGKQIQELKTRIGEASQRRKRYKIDVVLNSSGTSILETIDPRLPALYVESSSLVGINGPTDELIKLVDDGEQSLKVVSIVGLGGVGKTTLANQVYIKLGQQFHCQAFVSISQKPDVKNILGNILSQINKGLVQDKNREECWLIDELRAFLKDKRYFVIIDDIWSTEAWKFIKCALPENTCGSRILLTTRNGNVAKICCYPQHGTVYEIRPLNEADSKGLFFRRIFGSEEQCPVHLKDVSVGIINKCGGLPLALITIASLLAVKSKNWEEWMGIRNMIGLGLQKNIGTDEMTRILYLSYTDLPRHLKTCLLYLSMYPEDRVIDVQQLVRRWRAEGFIKEKYGRNLLEEGESYLNELINRSLIRPENIGRDGRAKTCRMHDIILDFIVSKAVEENFVTFFSDKVLEGNARRLLVDFRGKEIFMPMLSTATANANVRSLGIFGYQEEMLHISSHMHALRVLNIHCSKIFRVEVCDIGKLLQLRYLRIEAINVHLSDQIGELKFLETLDLSYCVYIKELPTSIVNLRRLKSLLVHSVRLPDGVGNMQALEELSRVNVDVKSSIDSLQQLERLTKLRRLDLLWSIPDKHNNESTYANTLALSLGKLLRYGLRYLEINNNLLSDCANIPSDFLSSPSHLLQELSIQACCLHRISDWVASASLTSLTTLAITVQQVTQETIEILGNFPALLYLVIWSKGYDTAKRLNIYSNRFGCLKTLELDYSPVNLMFHAGAMPKLESIYFLIKPNSMQSACDHQNLGIRHLLALRCLDVGIDCQGVRVEEVEALEAAINNEASLLPDCSSKCVYRYFSDDIGLRISETSASPEHLAT